MPLRGGAKKAYRSMRKTYGSRKKARQVFFATANKRGRGKSLDARVRSAYKRKRRRRRRRK